MQPRELSPANFETYPPEARKMALANLALLRDLPVTLAASLLREVIDLDDRFPAERRAVQAQFAYLSSQSAEDRHRATKGFADISLPPELIAEDWARNPQKFSEDLSAHLWASHQIDAFHTAGAGFTQAVIKATPETARPIPRLAVVILGPELRNDGYPLFRKLRSQGTFFPHVESGDGTAAVLKQLAERATAAPDPYGHWYIDGGAPIPHESAAVSGFSWAGSLPVRSAVLRKMGTVIGSVGTGPEMLRSIMAGWAAKEQEAGTGDPLVDKLVLRVYGEGSGTQIFSTSFAQWSAREVLRRAEPASLVVRFGPRQRQRGMNEMLAGSVPSEDVDIAGSLVDADCAAHYTWINLHRLEGSETATFLAWSETHRQAVATGPGFSRGSEAPDPIRLENLLRSLTQG